MDSSTSGGKLSIRPISTGQNEITWDISTCLHGWDNEVKYIKSPEFRFDDTIWYLFAKFKDLSISFGIDVRKCRLLNEVFDYYCKISYQDLNGVEYKSFDLVFECGNYMPFLCAKESFEMDISLHTLLKNNPGSANIVCCIGSEISTDIKYLNNSGASPASNYIHWYRYSIAFENDLPSGGGIYIRNMSTEVTELNWTISTDFSLDDRKELESPAFSFADATWVLLAKVVQDRMIFGINVRERNSSGELFNCCFDISFHSYYGVFYGGFSIKFKYGKTVPYLSIKQDFQLMNTGDSSPVSEKIGRDIVIRCRISSETITGLEAYLRRGFHYSSSNVTEFQNALHWPKNKDIKICNPIINLDCGVCQDFKNMLDSGANSDVTIQIGDQSFKAHRSILAARSSVFAAMLRHNMKEKSTGIVNVTDCDASSFPVFLEFLYCGSTEKLSVENVFSLYNTADKYDRQDLKMNCLQFMKINLCVANFCETVHLSLLHSETDLLKLSEDFFAKNKKEIIKTAKWHAFISENPIQGNELLTKALESGRQEDYLSEHFKEIFV